MDILDRLPFKSRKAAFERLEQLASKPNMTPQERAQYEEEWKVYNDFYNILDYAELKGRREGIKEGIQKEIEKGREKGRQEALFEIARKLKEQGFANDVIMAATELPLDEIENL